MNSDDYFGGVMAMESDEDEEHSENSSCLIRYRSAPTSYFSDFVDDSARIDYGDLHPPSPTPEIDTILTRFIPYDSCSYSRFDQLQTSPISVSEQPNLHCRSSAILPPRPQHCAAVAAATSGKQDPPSSILIRHSSSPAQLFSHDNSETGIGDPRSEGIPDHLSFTAGNPSSPSSAGICSVAVAGVDHISARDEGSGGGNGKCYISGYPLAPWKCSEKMNSLNGWEENGMNSGNGIHKSGTGYMRLPSSAVPCMTRAKRGCATHPRSIAERVRRTRISERMRKLEELVPNMEKQTSTADMLDLAVEYIKDLQQQVKILSEMGAKCTCRNGGKDAGMGVVLVVGTGTMAAPTTDSSRKS